MARLQLGLPPGLLRILHRRILTYIPGIFKSATFLTTALPVMDVLSFHRQRQLTTVRRVVRS